MTSTSRYGRKVSKTPVCGWLISRIAGKTLSKEEFEDILTKDFKLQLSFVDFDLLYFNYFNSSNRKLYTDKFVKDMRKLEGAARDSSIKKIAKSDRREDAKSDYRGDTKSDRKTIEKVSRHILKNKQDEKVMDEMFAMDQEGNGKLNFAEIKAAFHNAGVKLSSDQVRGVLEGK